MNKTRHFIAVILLVIVATIGLRVLFLLMFPLPANASIESIPIDIMVNAHMWMISFLFSLIMVIMVYAAFVFRRKADDETDAPHIHGNTALEISWTVIPTITVIGFGVWAATVLNDLVTPAPNEMVVQVSAKQWSWAFTYPDYDDNTTATLFLPVDTPILLEMESEDVLHSFWVPEFRVKQDLVPERTTYLRFTPTRVGDYKLRCAEICGAGHAGMLANVVVMSPEFFESTITGASEPVYANLTPAERGQLWYSNADGFGCEGCHTLDGSQGAGPTWQGLLGREEPLTDGTTVIVDEEYIVDSILNPDAQIVSGFNENVMPPDFADQFEARQEEILNDQQVEVDIIEDLLAYIETLEN